MSRARQFRRLVARRNSVAPNLLYRWRRLLSEGGAAAVALNLVPCFTPVKSPESNGMSDGSMTTMRSTLTQPSECAPQGSSSGLKPSSGVSGETRGTTEAEIGFLVLSYRVAMRRQFFSLLKRRSIWLCHLYFALVLHRHGSLAVKPPRDRLSASAPESSFYVDGTMMCPDNGAIGHVGATIPVDQFGHRQRRTRGGRPIPEVMVAPSCYRV